MSTRAKSRTTRCSEKQSLDAPPIASSSNDAQSRKKSLKRSRHISPPTEPDEKDTHIIQDRPAKKARAAKTLAQDTEVNTEKEKAAREKAEKAARKATAAAEKQTEKEEAAAKKFEEKQWKENWKAWVLKHDAADERFKCDPEAQDTLTQTNCKLYYKLTPEELKTLPHDEAFNSHNIKLPSKLFKRAEIQRLAFRKSAILSGVAQDHVDELLKQGKALFEDENGVVDTQFENRKQLAADEKKNKPKPRRK